MRRAAECFTPVESSQGQHHPRSVGVKLREFLAAVCARAAENGASKLLEAVVVVLGDDFAVAKLQKHGEVRAQLSADGEGTQRLLQAPRP